MRKHASRGAPGIPPGSGQTGETPVCPPILFVVHEVTTAVLLPATFVRFGTERLLLAVTEGFDAITRNSSLDERILDRVRAVRAGGEVIFGQGRARRSIPRSRDVDIGMLLQELRIGL